MATGYLNIGAMTTGIAPTGLTLSDQNTTTFTVADDVTAPLGKVIRMVGSGLHFAYASVDASGNNADQEVVVFIRIAGQYGVEYGSVSARARMLVTAGNIASYVAANRNDSVDQVIGRQNTSPLFGDGVVDSVNIYEALVADKIHKMRLRVTDAAGPSADMKAWFWKDADTDKLGTDTPDVTYNDGTPLASGYVGFGFHNVNVSQGPIDILWIGWATGSDHAPLTAGSASSASIAWIRA